MGTETHSSRRQTPIAWVLQLVFFPFVCLDCFSGREALRAFTQLAYLLSLSHCHIVILCYTSIYTSPVSTVVDLALKLRHTANAQRQIFPRVWQFLQKIYSSIFRTGMTIKRLNKEGQEIRMDQRVSRHI